MLSDISYKKKNRFLLGAMILAALFIYSFCIKKTLSLISEVKDTELKTEMAKDAPAASALLTKEIEKIDRKIGTKRSPGNDNQSLLGLVTSYCKSNNAVLREFPEATEAASGSFLVATNRFEVEGDFSSLLSLVYILEQKVDLGKIASVNYSLKKNLKNHELVLTATIYLQNIKKK
jgi:hypothetical protein